MIATQVSDLGGLLAGWVRGLGYQVQLLEDGPEAIWALHRGLFSASLLDSQLVAGVGEPVWRVVRPILGRRLILMTRDRSNELWFEALTTGVGTVLPLPPAQPMVRAALAAVDAC